jgi:release factor glutamine methyltransferase
MQPSSRAARIAAGVSIDAVLRNPPLDPLETRILIAHALKLSRVQLITQSERSLTGEEAEFLSGLFRRRASGEPIAYILGEREFYGLAFDVTPDVLIPRPETELLVDLAIERLPRGASMLDMGTGSGAIAVAVAHARPDAAVTAVDVSNAALQVARRNAARHGASVSFLHSDWYAGLGGRRFGLIAANPPYIAQGDAHLAQGDLRFEPVSALTDHADGLAALRTIVAGAPCHLHPGSWLLMEHGYDQAFAVRELLLSHGFLDAQSWRDLAGIERVSGGRVPS